MNLQEWEVLMLDKIIDVLNEIGKSVTIEKHPTDTSKLILNLSPEAELAVKILEKNNGKRENTTDTDPGRS